MSPFMMRLHWDVANIGFVIQELDLDSVQYLHDIIFCFETDSIDVSFSSRTVFQEQMSFSSGSKYHLLFRFIMYCSFYRQRTSHKVRVNQSGLLRYQHYNKKKLFTVQGSATDYKQKLYQLLQCWNSHSAIDFHVTNIILTKTSHCYGRCYRLKARWRPRATPMLVHPQRRYNNTTHRFSHRNGLTGLTWVFGFAFTQAMCSIHVHISMVLFNTCFLLQFPLVSLSSRGIENLQSRIVSF